MFLFHGESDLSEAKRRAAMVTAMLGDLAVCINGESLGGEISCKRMAKHCGFRLPRTVHVVVQPHVMLRMRVGK